MDKKDCKITNKFITNLTSISKDECHSVQQEEDETLTDMESTQTEASSLKRKLKSDEEYRNQILGSSDKSFKSDDKYRNEKSGNPSTMLLDPNLSYSAQEVNLDPPLKIPSKKPKLRFRSERGLVTEQNRTSASGRIIEESTSESDVSSTAYATFDEEFEISDKESKKHVLNEYTKTLVSEKTIKNGDFRPKKIFCIQKSEILEENTVGTQENATADTAGPSGYVKRERNGSSSACNLCPNEFSERLQSDAQCRTHANKKAFVCNKCQSKFPNSSELDRHYRTHSHEKPFVCEVCKQAFTRKKNLKAHFVLHTGEKPYVCDVCYKEYTQRGSLDRHYIIHTMEKHYECEVCNKRFSQKRNLKRHSVAHTGEKPHMCYVCNKVFTQKAHLNRHSLVHTGEKPFVCAVCKRGFTRMEYLKIHSIVHSSEKPYVCDICDKRYTRKINLDKHCITHADEECFL